MTRFVLAALAAVATASGQAPQSTVPMRHLTVAVQSPAPFKNVQSVRALSDGRLVVQDGVARRVVVLDSMLRPQAVAIDSAGSAVRNYGSGGATLICYPGDTTIFFDMGALSLVMIAPTGQIARTTAVPIAGDAIFLAAFGIQGGVGLPAFDPQTRLIYRGYWVASERPTPGTAGGIRFTGATRVEHDSMPIVRVAAGSVEADTIGVVHIPAPNGVRMTQTARGSPFGISIINPIPISDDWVVTSDGWLALIRGKDYHIDWVSPAGARTSTPKLPFDWRRLSDAEKSGIIDSVREFNQAHPSRMTLGARDGTQDTATVVQDVVPTDSLPDYRAPFAPGTSLADADGNVWIKTTPQVPLTSTPGDVYDVIGRAGLIERVQLPASMRLVGIGKQWVYMTSRGPSGTDLVAARRR